MKKAPIAMLLVEDNPGDAAWIGEMLAEATTVQFSVMHANRLSDALTFLRENSLRYHFAGPVAPGRQRA